VLQKKYELSALKLSIVVHAVISTTQEVGAGGSRVDGQPRESWGDSRATPPSLPSSPSCSLRKKKRLRI
jgi:hypothetical protein